MEEIFSNIAEMVVSGRVDDVRGLTREALKKGASPGDILNRGLMVGMEIVGRKFKVGDMYVPEVILSAKSMHSAMEELKPLWTLSEQISSRKIVIGTVEGDLHNVGKNLVAMVLEGSGFLVEDLGVDVKPQTFIEKVKEHKPDIVALSALLTTTMPKVAETIQAFKEAGLRDQVKILVGGAPITEQFTKEIGGDGYAPNALTAVDKAKELLCM